MATTPQDLIVNTESRTFKQMPNRNGQVIHSGDMVYVDVPAAASTSTYDIKAATSTLGAYFAGVCQDTYDPNGGYSVYGTTGLPPNGMMVQCAGVYYPYTTNTETYNPGDAVYIGADAQRVTVGTTASTNPVGYVADWPDGSNIGLAGTGTNQVKIYIRSNWPNTTV